MHGGFRRVRRRCSAAPGSEVQIAEGSAEFSQSNLVVKLDANPTTGYEWTFQIDGSAVQPDGDGSSPRATAPSQDGRRRLHVQLQSRRLGRGTLTFTYARSWRRRTATRASCCMRRLKTARSRRLKSRRKHQRADGRAPFPPFLVRML
ncbi:MAG: protease inhibitor I42 family protein [Eggerthellaceae bacterium]